MTLRQNEHSSEFVLYWEQNYFKDNMRASARIHLNDLDEFLKFSVELNEIPVKFDKVGKDVVADWTFYDDFDSK
jgi:hypothetical protein